MNLGTFRFECMIRTTVYSVVVQAESYQTAKMAAIDKAYEKAKIDKPGVYYCGDFKWICSDRSTAVVIHPIRTVYDDWGRVLGKMIGACEARVASYKKLVQEAYKKGDRELVELFKESQHDEEKWLKRWREEKTRWNAGF